MTRILSRPEPGWYKIRRAKDAVWMPILIYRPCPMDPDYGFPLDRLRQLVGLEDGVDEIGVREVWPYLRPISPAEYAFLVKDHEWARTYQPHLPQANPRQAVDLSDLPPLF